jgi:hypothetical protein
MAVEDSLDIFGADPFGRDVMYGLSTGQEPLGLAPPPQGLPVDTRPYDRMQATPRGFISGLFSDVLGRTFDMPALPRTGIPSIDLFAPNMNAFNRLALGDVQKTAERISYGEPLTTGSGMTLRPREETINAAMNVAPFVKPAAVMANRAAMTAGRAGERLAERVLPQVMERGGLPAQLLGDVSRGSVSPLDVYHGTPHTLPPTPRNPLGEFDASKIGSGEGAQAYGYGIYSAENPAVAKEYQFMQQNWFDTSKAKYKGKSIDTWYEQAQKDQERAFRTKNKALEQDATARLAYWENIMTHNHPENVLKQFTDPNYGWDAATNYAKSIDLGKFEGIPRTGNLYKVDLPDEKIATMLDWDKPVIQQKNVMNALRQEAEQRVKDRLLVNIENDIRSQLPAQDVGNDYMALFGDQNIAMNQDIQKQALARLNQLDLKPLVDQELDSFKTPDMNWDMSGRDFYELLSKRTGSPQQASSLLQNQGVAGIRYLDEGSRATTGKQTSNFVVFPNEEKSMTILERNGIPASQIENPAYTDPFGNTIGSSIR